MTLCNNYFPFILSGACVAPTVSMCPTIKTVFCFLMASSAGIVVSMASAESQSPLPSSPSEKMILYLLEWQCLIRHDIPPVFIVVRDVVICMQRKASSGLQASRHPAAARLGPRSPLNPPYVTMLIIFLRGWQVVIKMLLAEEALIVPPYKSAIRYGAMNSA